MIRIARKTVAGSLLALSLLWVLDGCTQVTARSRTEPKERPLKVESPVSVAPKAPAELEPPISVAPKAPSNIEPSRGEPDPRFYVHTVRWQGETLSLIAEWYTGSWRNWEAIGRANPRLDFKRIALGNRILIPVTLLKRHEPIPFDFLSPSSVSKQAAPPSPARMPPAGPDEKPAFAAAKTAHEPTAVAEDIQLFEPAETTGNRAPAPEEMELFGPAEIAERRAKIPEETELFGPVE